MKEDKPGWQKVKPVERVTSSMTQRTTFQLMKLLFLTRERRRLRH